MQIYGDLQDEGSGRSKFKLRRGLINQARTTFTTRHWSFVVGPSWFVSSGTFVICGRLYRSALQDIPNHRLAILLARFAAEL